MPWRDLHLSDFQALLSPWLASKLFTQEGQLLHTIALWREIQATTPEIKNVIENKLKFYEPSIDELSSGHVGTNGRNYYWCVR